MYHAARDSAARDNILRFGPFRAATGGFAMERCPNEGARRDTCATPSDSLRQRSAIAAALGLAPPFRIRWHREPADAYDGFATLELGPITTDDFLAALQAATRPLETIVLVDARRTFGGRAEHMSRALSSLFERQGLSRSLVVDSSTLRVLAHRAERRLTIARVDGPVDISDARALEGALRSGRAPLEAELRATSIVQISPSRHASAVAWGQFRADESARRLLGECFARWLSRSLGGLHVAAPNDTIVRRALAADRTIRTRDLREVTGMLDIAVRAPRGRIESRITLDRATGAWYG